MEKKGGCLQGNGLWLGKGRPLLITKHGSHKAHKIVESVHLINTVFPECRHRAMYTAPALQSSLVEKIDIKQKIIQIMYKNTT